MPTNATGHVRKIGWKMTAGGESRAPGVDGIGGKRGSSRFTPSDRQTTFSYSPHSSSALTMYSGASAHSTALRSAKFRLCLPSLMISVKRWNELARELV